jgi:hypothetical protein
MMFVGVGQPGTTDGPGLHHPAFLPHEETVGEVARAMLAGYVAACSVVLPDAAVQAHGDTADSMRIAPDGGGGLH